MIFKSTLTAAIVAILAAIACAPASAAEKAIWGPLDLPNGQSAFPTYRDLGVDTLQMAVDMSDVAPTRPANVGDPSDPAYRWPADVDRAVREARGAGIQVALLVQNAPRWANGSEKKIEAPDPEAFGGLVAAASKRYPTVKRWMIWGEPNREDRFLPNTEDGAAGPRAYARVLDAAYTSLKRVSSGNIVIGGMTWTGGTVKPATWLDLMRLPNGRPPRLDWFGHNPFPFRFPNLAEIPIRGGWRDISDLDTFSSQLRKTYGKRAKFWLSEFIVQSDKGSREFLTSVSRPEQARWLTAAYRIADTVPQVAGLGWLGLLDEPEAEGSANRGLLTAGGARKPAYAAFQSAPGVRLRAAVRAGRSTRVATLRAGRYALQVRPKATGRVRVSLLRRGKAVARSSRVVRAGKSSRLRLRYRKARRGAYELVVSTPRGESVRRAIRVR